jgi:hypothetical protein
MPCVIVLQHHVDVVQLHCASSSITMSMSYSRPCTMGMLAWSTNGGDQGKNHGFNSLTDILSFTGTHASSLRERISYLGGHSCGPAVLPRRHSCSGGCSATCSLSKLGFNSLTDILSFTGTHASSLRESISYLGGHSCEPAVLPRRHSCSGGCSPTCSLSKLILGSGLDERLLRSMLSMECMIKHMS